MKQYSLILSLWFISLTSLGYSQSATFAVDHNVLQGGQNTLVNITITSPYDGNMSLEIFNTAGELIKSFPGTGTVTANVPVTFQWDGTNGGSSVASGVYFFLLKLPLGIQTRRIIFIR